MSTDMFQDVLDMLGMSEVSVPETPGERFLSDYKFGANPKINNFWHWLRHALAYQSFLVQCGCSITKTMLKDGQVSRVDVTVPERARMLAEYYCLSHYYHRFHSSSILEKSKVCDIQEVITGLLDWPDVQEAIKKQISEDLRIKNQK